MGYIVLPTRTSNDLNSSADINQLMENIEYVKAQTENNNNIITNNIELQNATYSPYYVQSSAPSSPYHGYLWYNTTNNKLYKYNAETQEWVEINWQLAVQATPEWQENKLRIGADGILEIADAQSTPVWRDCYPLFGANKIRLTDTTKKYYLPISITAVITENIVPIVYCLDLVTTFKLNGMYALVSSNGYIGLWLNETSVAMSGVHIGTINYTTYAHTLAMQAYSVTNYTVVVGGVSFITIGNVMVIIRQ